MEQALQFELDSPYFNYKAAVKAINVGSDLVSLHELLSTVYMIFKHSFMRAGEMSKA